MKAFTKQDVIEKAREYDVKFIRLQFTNILGSLKNIAITIEELERALNGQISFDSSVIEGSTGFRESSVYLYPDPSTFVIFPWRPREGAVARLICDVVAPDGSPFGGCSRLALRNVINEYSNAGLDLQVGAEVEFFLFHTDERGKPTVVTHDQAGYCDMTPVDMGENARRDMVLTLQEMGFDVSSSHHEIAPGQHEIFLKEDNALTMADSIATFKFVVRTIAQRHGLHATFMPKPLADHNGSGMHLHYSLWEETENIFHDQQAHKGHSEILYNYTGGILYHARAITAVTNPLINSYKRLALNDLAPVLASWSAENRSTMLRVENQPGKGPSVVLRSPDPASNPYLALAVTMKAGLDGVEKKMSCPAAVSGDSSESVDIRRLRREMGLPPRLEEALKALNTDDVIGEALGGHIRQRFMKTKESELERFHLQVHQWEIEEYLKSY
ncbi:MAG: glutamine synthetase [Firmicutes bacterium]|nr:glutamine synthetase [Bacillota bacterium]